MKMKSGTVISSSGSSLDCGCVVRSERRAGRVGELANTADERLRRNEGQRSEAKPQFEIIPVIVGWSDG